MKLILCGDLVPTVVTVPAFEAKDIQALMGDTSSVIRTGDFAVANLECALTDSEQRIRKCGPNLKGKPEYARLIRECGFSHMGLCNNHVMDFGIQGLRDTVNAVEAGGMAYFGIGENDQDSRKYIILEKNGEKTAIVAVCEHEYSYALPDRMGANPFDPFDSMEDIACAKQEADHVVVLYHGGKEHCEYPSPRLRKACQAMVRAGAEMVLCQHSHCIGCYENYRGGEILYGQGNFNFVERSENPHLHSGLIVSKEWGKPAQYIPVVTTDSGITLAKGEEKQQLLDGLEERSRILQNPEAWNAAWMEFCESVPYYLPAASEAFQNIPEGEICKQVFPHYLDCEAHLDVWKTIFKTWHAEKKSGA